MIKTHILLSKTIAGNRRLKVRPGLEQKKHEAMSDEHPHLLK